jgi:hypothetical protein
MWPNLESGYSVYRIFNNSELISLRNRINTQIIDVLAKYDAEAYELLKGEDDPLSVYHKLCTKELHGSTWIKTNRILSEADTAWIENTSSIMALRNSFGSSKTSDEERLGRGNYYWRIIRPGTKDDVGPMHRDAWFWQLNDDYGQNMTGLQRLKVWIAVETAPGLNGLLVQPGSHLREDFKWEGTVSGGMKKPVLKSQVAPSSLTLLSPPPGHGVIFHDKLLHGGAVNGASRCRCSIEFTLLVPTNPLQ